MGLTPVPLASPRFLDYMKCNEALLIPWCGGAVWQQDHGSRTGGVELREDSSRWHVWNWIIGLQIERISWWFDDYNWIQSSNDLKTERKRDVKKNTRKGNREKKCGGIFIWMLRESTLVYVFTILYIVYWKKYLFNYGVILYRVNLFNFKKCNFFENDM